MPPLLLEGHHDGIPFRFRLRPGSNTIGARRENDVCIDASGISKRHAVIRVAEGRLSLEDLASKNGTYVNGRRVRQTSIEIGDQIGFASLVLTVTTTSTADGTLAVALDENTPPGGESAFQNTSWLRPAHCTDADRRAPVGRDPVGRDPSDRGPVREQADFDDLVFPESWIPGSAPAMVDVLSRVRVLADAALPVLVIGETGTGKEGIAQTLHLSSHRASRPFVAINCAAIPEALLEAELFGVGAGVATGVERREGRFREAQGGTLFLDEIGDMPANLQAKLLRVLEAGEIQPLGGRTRTLDVRVVSATHDDLEAAMAAGRFRRDLFYRLAGITLQLPPLRQRRDDIAALVTHFLAAESHATKKDIRGITHEVMARLYAHPWPGNVRQLRHAIARWVHLCPDHQVIDAERIAGDTAFTSEASSAVAPNPGPRTDGASAHPQEPARDEDLRAGSLDAARLRCLELSKIEAMVIEEALRRTDGNLTQAARALGLSRQALRRRLARHAAEAEGRG